MNFYHICDDCHTYGANEDAPTANEMRMIYKYNYRLGA